MLAMDTIAIIAMVSSVDLFALEGKQMGIKWGLACLDMFEDHPLQALGEGGCECDTAIVVEVGHGCCFGDRDDGGRLQAGWYVRERLKILMKTCVSWIAQALKTPSEAHHLVQWLSWD